VFKCHCGKVVEKPVQTVILVREKEYPYRRDAHPLPYKRIDGKKFKDDPGGKGLEIVYELKSCPDCGQKALAEAKKIGAIPEQFPANHRTRRAARCAPQSAQADNLPWWQAARQMENEKRWMQ
jgi:hypothetical protein